MKAKTKNILKYSIIGIIIVIIVAIIFASPTQLSTSTQTADIGEVTTTVSSCNWLCTFISNFKPVSQTVFFTQSEMTAGTSITAQPVYKVGDTIYLYSRSSCSDSTRPAYTKLDAKTTTYITNTATGASSATTLTSTNVENMVNFYVTTNIPASKEGSWTTYNTVDCYLPGTSTRVAGQTYASQIRKFSVVATSSPVVCASDRQTTGNSYYTSSYTNVQQVICEKWVTSTNVNDVCHDSYFDKNCKTTCLSDAFCDNTFSTQSCDGKVSCIKQEVVTTTCDDGSMNGDETGIDCGGSCPACTDTGNNTIILGTTVTPTINTNTGITGTTGTTGTELKEKLPVWIPVTIIISGLIIIGGLIYLVVYLRKR